MTFFLWNNEWFVIIKILQTKPVKNMLIKLVYKRYLFDTLNR